ncbi:MAG: TonB family protein [Deltaproteobacteria bacterium]|nr:TonB family protein [Deltaproteobacteria bacterium]
MAKRPRQDTMGIGRTTRLLFKAIRPKRRSLFILLSVDALLVASGAYFIWTWGRSRTPQAPAPALIRHQPMAHDAILPDAGTLKPSMTARTAVRRKTRRGVALPRGHVGVAASRPTGLPPGGHAPIALGRDAGLPTNQPQKNRPRRPDSGVLAAPTDAAASSPGIQNTVTETQRTKYRNALRKALRSRRKNVKQCYHESLKLIGHGLSGRLLLRFRLKADGRVETVSSTQNTTGSPTLERCILAVMRAVRFPAPPSGTSEFVYPISFKAQK